MEEIKYKYEQEDYSAFIENYVEISPFFKKHIQNAQISQTIIAGIVFALLIKATYVEFPYIAYVILMLVISAVIYFVLPSTYLKSTIKNTLESRKEHFKKYPVETTTATLLDKSISLKSEIAESTFTYDLFEGLVETPTYFFLCLSNGSGLSINKSKLLSGNIDSFITIFKTKLSKDALEQSKIRNKPDIKSKGQIGRKITIVIYAIFFLLLIVLGILTYQKNKSTKDSTGTPEYSGEE